jgi:hypothetical protein
MGEDTVQGTRPNGAAVAECIWSIARQLGLNPLVIGSATALVGAAAATVIIHDITEEWWAVFFFLWYWVVLLQALALCPCVAFHYSRYWKARGGLTGPSPRGRDYALGLARYLGSVSVGAVAARMVLLSVINVCEGESPIIPRSSLFIEVVLNLAVWAPPFTVMVGTVIKSRGNRSGRQNGDG